MSDPCCFRGPGRRSIEATQRGRSLGELLEFRVDSENPPVVGFKPSVVRTPLPRASRAKGPRYRRGPFLSLLQFPLSSALRRACWVSRLNRGGLRLPESTIEGCSAAVTPPRPTRKSARSDGATPRAPIQCIPAPICSESQTKRTRSVLSEQSEIVLTDVEPKSSNVLRAFEY